MLNPDARSAKLADRLLALGATELGAMVAQLHPSDLAAAWQALSPWQCELIWQRYRHNHPSKSNLSPSIHS